MSDSSPKWMKPSDVLKIRRRKSFAAKASPEITNGVESCHVAVSPCSLRQNAIKRKNPFSRSSVDPHVKRLSLDSICLPNALDEISCLNQSRENIVLQAENKLPVQSKLLESSLVNECSTTSSKDSEDMLFHQKLSKCDIFNGYAADSGFLPSRAEVACTQSKSLTENQKEIIAVSPSAPDNFANESRTFPVDWSLRTKARFVSPTPFCCSSLFSSADEAHGTVAFIRCTSSPPHLQNVEECVLKQEFQRYLMFWTHPNIPWLSNFPRIINSIQQLSNGFVISDEGRQALQEDWRESMNAAYQNLRNGICSYMYVCCHHLTILFRAANVAGTEMNAIITPTTKGLRESLRAEGIEFQLPLQEQSDAQQSKQIHSSKDSKAYSDNSTFMDLTKEENDDEETVVDGADVVWLEELGLDRKQFRSFETSKVKHGKDRFREIDHRPESTLLVKGSANLHALFNYLINCSGLIPSTGSQAGIPPTILSPVAFKGATLQSLKMRQGNILWPDSKGQKIPAHSIEITGPILPQSLAGFCRLFSQTQSQFSATFALHEPTVPFNCGMRSDDSDKFCVGDIFGYGVHLSNLDETAVRDLFCKEGTFRWSLY